MVSPHYFMANFYRTKASTRQYTTLKLKIRALSITISAVVSMAILIASISNVSLKEKHDNLILAYKVNLSGNPSGVFNTPSMVRGITKNTQERCLKLEVILDENAEGIIFEKRGTTGLKTESVYTVNDVLSAKLGSPICLNEQKKAIITYWDDGTETAYYRVTSVPRLKLEYDSVLLLGAGEKQIKVSGLESESIHWKVLQGSKEFIKTIDPSNAITLDDKLIAGDQKILIEVSGTHVSTCGGSYSCRQVIQIACYEPLKLNTTPQKSICARGGSVTMQAFASGGKKPYSYIWKTQDGRLISFNETCSVEEPGNYTVEVSDATKQALLSQTISIDAANIVLPTMIQSNEVSQNTARIVWNALSNTSKYKVRYKEAGSSSWQFVQVDANETEAYLKKLSPGKEYDYQLMVYGKQSTDTSGWSKTYHLTTLSECVPATQLSSKTTYNKLLCKWKLNPYNSKQVLLLRPAGNSEWTRQFKIGSNVFAVYLDNLKSDMIYEWMIISYCKDGEIPSSIQTFKCSGTGTTVASN